MICQRLYPLCMLQASKAAPGPLSDASIPCIAVFPHGSVSGELCTMICPYFLVLLLPKSSSLPQRETSIHIIKFLL